MRQDESHTGGNEAAIMIILPLFKAELGGYSCSKEWCEDKRSHACGCPKCLDHAGLTLCWSPEDWNESGDLIEHWSKRVVSQKTARLCTHLIIQGYPGND